MTKKEFLKRIDKAIETINKEYEEYSCNSIRCSFPLLKGFYSVVEDTYNILFNNENKVFWLDDYIYQEQPKWTPEEVRIFFITMFAEWCLVHKEYKMF
jgi:hypothetical protein